MLASLLCIQNRQVSGTPRPLILDRCFDSKEDGLFCDGVQDEVVLEIKEYKKEARKLVKDKGKVESYISVIAVADRVPEEIQPLKDMVTDGSLVSRLESPYCDTDVILSFTVQCYLFYCKWKQRNDDDENAILVLMLS